MSNITGNAPYNASISLDRAVNSPYSTDRVPPPTPQEWAAISGKRTAPSAHEKAVQITTKVMPELVYIMDRLIEKRVYKCKSRHDFMRLAIQNLVTSMVDEIQQGYLSPVVYRMEQMTRTAMELEIVSDVQKMIVATQRVVAHFLDMEDRFEAIRALRSAKRYAEQLSHEHLKAKVVNCLYGSKDGKSRPDPATWGEAEELWHEVITGESDRDDEDEVAERMRVL